jgi:stearoyl-CoA desaturase (Delta-9 desaturase)
MSEITDPTTGFSKTAALDRRPPYKRPPEQRPPVPGDITVDSPDFQRLQKRVASATIILPFLFTVLAFVLLIWVPLTWIDIALFAVFYLATTIGITVGFHRQFAHRSFKATPALRVALGILGSMAAQGNLIYWVATHRRHHQYSEGDGDPHSPYTHGGKLLGRLQGIWHSHLGWMLDSQMTNTVKFTKDLMRDPAIRRVNDLYFLWVALGLAIPAILGGLLSWSWTGALTGFLWGGAVRMFLAHHAMWTSGSTAHMIGTRPFPTRDMSTNNPLLALPNLGEAWHNNHHAFPSSALFGLAWWQVDIGGLFIRLCEKLGWAWDVRKPSREMIEGRKLATATAGPVDADTW